MRIGRGVPVCIAFLLGCSLSGLGQSLGSHRARYDAQGTLQPWTSWGDALEREMNWFLRCPLDHGYPGLVTITFMNGDYTANENRTDTIPAMQDGMGIISYLKYYSFRARKAEAVLRVARAMGDYLIQEATTPNEGRFPRFTRSTGVRGKFPQPPDAGRQEDRPYEIEPDKGGIAAYALLALYQETRDQKYLAQALHNARVLATNMIEGSATNSPWPFRVDYRTGEGRGPVSANMSYILRLFDSLIALKYAEFRKPRDDLWRWIKTRQIPDAGQTATLWVQFHEDYDMATNRNAWSALNLARYLVEKRSALDPDWEKDSRLLIELVLDRFVTVQFGVPVCGEQDDDKSPWGGALSNFGGTLAVYSAATGSNELKGLAHTALTLALYAIDEDGCPRDSLLKSHRGGWLEDAHTDVIHNFVDALTVFPEWER